MRALIMTADAALVESFTQICRELGLDVESVADLQNTLDRVNRRKYEAVLLDADTVGAALPVLAAVRESPSNRGAVAFVVATQMQENLLAFSRGAHFVFRRPLNDSEIRRACRAAYDLMLDESRQYFRTRANLAVRIATPKAMVESSTINISANGMAVRTLFLWTSP